MARSFTTDPLLSHNFALLEVPVGGAIPLAFPVKTIQDAVGSGAYVGFKSIQMPTIDVETKEIKEGNNPRIHSVLTGFSNSGEVELEMALWPWSVDMFVYFAQAMYGRYSPRRSFLVVNLKNEKSIPWRVLLLESCVPKQWVPSSALDANTTEVLVETMTLDVHRIVPVAAPIPSFPINQIPSTPRGGQY